MTTESFYCNCNNALCIMNNFFQYRDLRKYTWCRDWLGQWSIIDFCIFSADVFQSVLDVRVERCAELVDRSPPGGPNLRLEKSARSTLVVPDLSWYIPPFANFGTFHSSLWNFHSSPVLFRRLALTTIGTMVFIDNKNLINESWQKLFVVK